MEEDELKDKLLGGIIGLALGDALGLPVEFWEREDVKKNPVTGMRGSGSHNQSKGTWSDDTTMTLCLMESLINGLDYDDIWAKFFSWVESGFMTPYGKAFGIGQATFRALMKYVGGMSSLECGGIKETDNGNGSLMRVLPLVFFTQNMTVGERLTIAENVSALTHAHIRSKIACSIYVQFVCELLSSKSKADAQKDTVNEITKFYSNEPELNYYNRFLENDISKLHEDEVKSSGFVVDTFEAAMWCFFTTDNYKDCVLKAVNLGHDTDTVAAIAGGMAGVYYGYESIPTEWVDCIAKIDMIKELCDKFLASLNP